MTFAVNSPQTKKVSSKCSQPLLSLIVPCHNESHRILQLLKGIQSFKKAFSEIQFEIILVNAASKDDTLNRIKQIKEYLDLWIPQQDFILKTVPIIKVVNFNQSGKGAAINEGIKKSIGKWVFLCDADFPLREKSWNILKSSFFKHKNVDFICGLRKISKHSRAISRTFISKAFSSISNKIILNSSKNPSLKDPQCCIKIIRSDLAKHWAKQSKQKGFLWDLEWLRAAVEHHLIVASIPLSWNDPYKSHINWFIDPIKMLIGLFELRYQDSFYLPESYILGTGFEH